ncbi:hypothetical protein GCM10007874_12670 [Labrys miyagiensis]|uniref:Uncharacterized protein n=1 Tax=Labrys miyagiensis TaxID=346912 RepID=A0ABQ6CD00_9HYPH|nr:hypothetical protein GCM10007874_12670 [Labrys miyagiensis]
MEMNEEVGHRRLARRNERSDSRELTDKDESAGYRLDVTGHDFNRRQWIWESGAPRREFEKLHRDVFKKEQCGNDAKDPQHSRRPD